MNNDERDIAVSVNGIEIVKSVPSRMLLTDFLRTVANKKSVRFGCEEGSCGACTVEIDGEIVKSCLVLAASVHGKVITTVENYRNDKIIQNIQEAFVGSHALQCGYCTSGMIMSAAALIKRSKGAHLSDDEIKTGISGNICRCTGSVSYTHLTLPTTPYV